MVQSLCQSHSAFMTIIIYTRLDEKYGDSEDSRLKLTAKNTVISPNFLVWKFCGKEQFPHNFGQIARNYAETALFHKTSTLGH